MKIVFILLTMSLSSFSASISERCAYTCDKSCSRQARDVRDILKEHSQYCGTRGDRDRTSESLYCFASSVHPGKFYIENPKSEGDKIGGYYEEKAHCKMAVSRSKNGMFCAISEKYPGQAYLNVISKDDIIGGYYRNLSQCMRAMKYSSKRYICTASEKYKGKFYTLDIAKDDIRGGYYDSFEECL